MSIRTYSELIRIPTFEERLKYLQLFNRVGDDTFGFDRYINQQFYRSSEWKQLRNHIIVRDRGCDLGVTGYEIVGKPIIHHMNPLTVNDIKHSSENLLNPEYLILTQHETHNAIHYGTEIISKEPIIRSKNDTCPWKRG
ncbi:MAG: hypothetical protein IJJ10_03220 [Bacillus sp. (in: Bacteria)]|nr:hypothetical protein [Bacillus sp. (in: firmicutes)]